MTTKTKKVKCTGYGKVCRRLATKQTVKGQYAEANGHLPQNFGYYCDDCYAQGLKDEYEAMYGWPHQTN